MALVRLNWNMVIFFFFTWLALSSRPGPEQACLPNRSPLTARTYAFMMATSWDHSSSKSKGGYLEWFGKGCDLLAPLPPIPKRKGVGCSCRTSLALRAVSGVTLLRQIYECRPQKIDSQSCALGNPIRKPNIRRGQTIQINPKH